MEAIINALNSHPKVALILAVLVAVGFVVVCIKIKADDSGKVEKKRDVWLRWSLFISAFIISPVFCATALVVYTIGKIRPGEKNWKYALAIVCLLYELFKQ